MMQNDISMSTFARGVVNHEHGYILNGVLKKVDICEETENRKPDEQVQIFIPDRILRKMEVPCK